MHAGLSGAGDVMLAATYAIEFGLTVDDLADTWAPCLTASEALRITAGLFLHEHDDVLRMTAARRRPRRVMSPMTRPGRLRWSPTVASACSSPWGRRPSVDEQRRLRRPRPAGPHLADGGPREDQER